MADDYESETLDHVSKISYQSVAPEPRTWADLKDQLVWENIFRLSFFHLGFFAAVITYTFQLHSVPMKSATIIWGFILITLQGIGVTAGAHRLWTHRAYKAKLPLKILLMLLYCTSGMNTIFHWVKDHRVHHKYSETDADPHNAKRGFFFSHMGWIMLRRHPEYIRRGKEVDMSDIIAEPVVMFHKKHATALKWLICFAIPTVVPIFFWEETILNAVYSQCFMRHVIALHCIWSVNSVAHLWGDRPYNKLINPAENLCVSLVTAGEGSHNYHHTFPWDYKASELPYMNFNVATGFIDAMAQLGLAYDLREPSREFVDQVIERLGYKSKIQVTR